MFLGPAGDASEGIAFLFHSHLYFLAGGSRELLAGNELLRSSLYIETCRRPLCLVLDPGKATLLSSCFIHRLVPAGPLGCEKPRAHW